MSAQHSFLGLFSSVFSCHPSSFSPPSMGPISSLIQVREARSGQRRNWSDVNGYCICCKARLQACLQHSTVAYHLALCFSHLIKMKMQFSSVLELIGLLAGREGQFNRDPVPVFSAGDHWEQFWLWLGYPLSDIIHPAFPLPITPSLTLQGALKDGFEEAVLVCDTPESCQFLSLDSCQKRYP